MRQIILPPRLAKVEWLSPSRYAVLEMCFLRFGLEAMRPVPTEIPTSAAALLGTVIHRVLEMASRLDPVADPREARRQAETEWTEAIAVQLEKLRQRPYDQHLLVPKRWPNYYLQRARALRTAAEILQKRGRAAGETAAPIGVELQVQSDAYRLRGRIDRVSNSDEGPIIVDWKTGEMDETHPEERYRMQLLLYAAMYGDAVGIWPRKARLQSPMGATAEFSLNKEDCVNAALKAKHLLDVYNHAISQRTPEELASPSADACTSCAFRAHCDTYWRSKPDVGFMDIEGVVVSATTPNERESWALCVRVCGRDQLETNVDLVSLPQVQFSYLAAIRFGAQVRAISFVGTDDGKRLFPTARSQVVVTD